MKIDIRDAMIREFWKIGYVSKEGALQSRQGYENRIEVNISRAHRHASTREYHETKSPLSVS